MRPGVPPRARSTSWHTRAIVRLRRWRQEDEKLKAILGRHSEFDAGLGDFINKTKKEKQLNKQRMQAWGAVVPFVVPATQEAEAGGSLTYVQSISLER